MALARRFSGHVGILEAGLALIVAIGLALPFAPIPREHSIRIAVRFWSRDMARPASFIVHTSSNICYVLSRLVSYRDPETGEFVQIDCGKKADAAAREIHAARTAGTPQAPPIVAQ